MIGRRVAPTSLVDRLVSDVRATLTPRELAYCVELLGKGVTLKDAIDRIQRERPTLPFTPPEAA